MKTHHKVIGGIVTVILILFVGSKAMPNPYPVVPAPIATPSANLSTPSATLTSDTCDPTLWQHVYNPQRLIKQPQGCITVTGTIDFVRKEADGDSHVGLKLDSQFSNLVNSCNSTCMKGAEHGDLVVEPVCENSITQKDTLDQGVCNGFHQTIQVPSSGTHVKITGEYVLDNDHGWFEVHPVDKIEVIQ